jgi:outer membrane protein
MLPVLNSPVFFTVWFREYIKMDAKMFIKAFALIGLLVVSGASFAELKIGFVNVPRVLEKAPQAEDAKKRLEREFSPRDKQLVAQQKEIKSLEDKMSRDSAILGEAELRKLERDIVNKKREAQRAQAEFSEDFNMRRNEELGKLQRGILEAIKAIAKEENFDLLLTDGVVFANEQIDITDRVQKKLAQMPK